MQKLFLESAAWPSWTAGFSASLPTSIRSFKDSAGSLICVNAGLVGHSVLQIQKTYSVFFAANERLHVPDCPVRAVRW